MPGCAPIRPRLFPIGSKATRPLSLNVNQTETAFADSISQGAECDSLLPAVEADPDRRARSWAPWPTLPASIATT